MLERMGQWQPELSEEQIREVLRTSLKFYSTTPGRDEIMRSVASLKQSLPYLQRIAVLDDLTYIAESDGEVSERELEIVSAVSSAFDVQVRMEGETF